LRRGGSPRWFTREQAWNPFSRFGVCLDTPSALSIAVEIFRRGRHFHQREGCPNIYSARSGRSNAEVGGPFRLKPSLGRQVDEAPKYDLVAQRLVLDQLPESGELGLESTISWLAVTTFAAASASDTFRPDQTSSAGVACEGRKRKGASRGPWINPISPLPSSFLSVLVLTLVQDET